MAVYLVLFLAAAASATLLPGSPSTLLTALIVKQEGQIALLIAFATVGSVVGSTINYAIGQFLARYVDRPWFPFSAAQIERAGDWFRRHGMFSLLFAWLPVVGDPLTLAAGTLRAPLRAFLLLVSIGKLLRYLLAGYIALQLSGGV